MKTFRFARLKRIREIEKRIAEERFAEALHQLNDLVTKARGYANLYKEYKYLFENGKLDWLELYNLIKLIENIQFDLKNAYNTLRMRREELLRANVSMKMMEKLEEMWREEFFAEEMHVLQEILDDFASYVSFTEKSQKERR